MRTVMLTPHYLPTPAFSSLAVATGNQADSRGSLISVDSNPSNSDRNSEKMDGCEKVRKEKGKTAIANVLHTSHIILTLFFLWVTI